MFVFFTINCVKFQPLLLDEIFCQLLKQTSNCQYPQSCLKAWYCLYLMLLSYKPTDEIYKYLWHHCLVVGLESEHTKCIGYDCPESMALLCLKHLDPKFKDKIPEIKKPVISDKLPEYEKTTPFGMNDDKFRPFPTLQSTDWMIEVDKLLISPTKPYEAVIDFLDKSTALPIDYLKSLTIDEYVPLIAKKLNLSESLQHSMTLQIRIEKADVIHNYKSIQDKCNEILAIQAPTALALQYVQNKQTREYNNLKYKFVLFKWFYTQFDKELTYETEDYIQIMYEEARRDIKEGTKLHLSKVDVAMAVCMEMFNNPDIQDKLYDLEELEEETLYEFLPVWARKGTTFIEWKPLVLKIAARLGQMGLINCKNKKQYWFQYLTHIQNQRLYGLSYFAAKMIRPPQFTGKFFLIAMNWTNLCLCNIDGKVNDEWNIKQIKYLKKADQHGHEVEWQIKLNDQLSIPFQCYLFRELADVFVNHVNALRVYVPPTSMPGFQ